MTQSDNDVKKTSVLDHLRELRRRLIWSLIAVVITSFTCFFFVEDIFEFLKAPVYEGNETFYLNLANPTNATVIDDRGMGTIVDDDLQPTLSIGDVTGSEDGGIATFTVSLSSPSSFPVTVDYSTADGTATAGSDYIAASGTLTFNPGDTAKTMSVPIVDDSINEGNETFYLNLANPTNAAIIDDQGMGTIVDNGLQPTLSTGDVTGSEDGGIATFTVSLSSPSSSPVTVDYSTADGTATADSDYIATSGTLTFNPGDTAKTIPVPIVDDSIGDINLVFIEMTEGFTTYMRISLAGGIVLAMPFLIYQFLMFVLPALTGQERKMVLIILPVITVMFAVGVFFAYRYLIPPAVGFLLTFGAEVAEPQIRMSNYVNFMTRLLLAIGIMFELPVLTSFLARMGIITSKWLADRRRIMIIFAFVIAAIITPTPDMVNQSIVAGVFIVLYELSIWTAKLVQRRRAKAVVQAESPPLQS